LTNGNYQPKFTSHTKGVNLKAGYDFNEYIGIEAKYLYTPWGDEDRTLKHYGLYLKPSYPITESLDIYALLGYGKTECESLKDSEKGFGWGVGASYNFGKRVAGKKEGLGVYVEYLRPLKKTGNKKITIDTVNAGLQYNF
jgi:opacity protein-like surface antigen